MMRVFIFSLLTIFPSLLIAQEVAQSFPLIDLLPKRDTGAIRFLKSHPQADGRGVTVAIFDTGIDPGVAGLQTTPDGRPKIIDMIDGTGSGDVVTTTVQKVTENFLTGLSGRKLAVDPTWENPSGNFHLGMKPGYELFPDHVVNRVKVKRKKAFEKQHRLIEETVREKIQTWKTKHPSPTTAEKLTLIDLEDQLSQLQFAWKSYEDPGPLFDCVVFHDGKNWQAVVDTDSDGNLAEEKMMTDYRKQRQYSTFGHDSFVNFSVNIYQEGKLLSLVTDSGAHGTHVGGIVAAYYPNAPDRNGLAPGAQLVSVKIGDTRIDGMETGAGILRGLNAVLRNQCDLINMSYGEPSRTPNRGRLIELMSKAVTKHNVIFCASAGNAGPALSTVGSPGGTSSAMLGIGAYVSPELMQAAYGMKKVLPGMPFTWTSRGPTTDGDFGVDLFAPGGAVAPVPTSMETGSLRMNGTSMASPNACGNIALILSGLKAAKAKYTPESVQRALAHTAKPVLTADLFSQGLGLIQTDLAFEHLIKHQSSSGEQFGYKIAFPARNHARGIYLREPWEATKRTTETVSISVEFPESISPEDKRNFEMRFRLECLAEWVSVGEFFFLGSADRTFEMVVDPTKLKPGLHTTTVSGIDADHPERGVIFRVPVTIIKPETVPDTGAGTLGGSWTLDAGATERLFVEVPDGATWMELKFNTPAENSTQRFVVHTVQLNQDQSFEENEHREYFTLGPDRTLTRTLAVIPGRTLEVCVGQYWSSIGESQLNYEFKFRGIQPHNADITLNVAEPATRVVLRNNFHPQILSPSATLKTHRQKLRPKSAKISKLTKERDLLIDEKLASELLLTYEFQKSTAGTVTLHFPANDPLLYESPIGTQLWMLFDQNKRRVMTNDVFTDPVKLDAGKYTLRLQLTHSSSEQLAKLKQSLLFVDHHLSSEMALPCYASQADAWGQGKKFGRRLLQPAAQKSVWIGTPSQAQLGKFSAGDELLGTVTFGSSSNGVNGSGQRPEGFQLRLTIPPTATNPKSATATAGKSPKTEAEKLQESVREFRIKQLEELSDPKHDQLFEKLYKELEREKKSLPLLRVRLLRLDTTAHRKERLPEVVAAADALLKQIDSEKLLNRLGTRVNPEDEQQVKQRKEDTEQKEILVDALYRKGRALGYMELPDVIAKHPITNPAKHHEAFEQNYAELLKWDDPTEENYFLLAVRREKRLKRVGTALEILNEYLPKAPANFWHYKKRGDLYELLEWEIWKEYERTWLLLRFPKTYATF